MTFKGAWTQSNRDMAFSLYDSWHRAHILRDQVSTEGLKNMINFKKGSGEKDSPSSVNSSSPTGQPGGTSGRVSMVVMIHNNLLTQSRHIPMGQFLAYIFLIQTTLNYLWASEFFKNRSLKT